MSQSNSPKQLLLLNTNQERREAIENLLSQGTKFSLLIASNVRDALTILKTESVDFIVSNINLDNFDGWRLARMVRSGVLNCSAQTPFVVVANTWCEHLASATAREFGINRLIAFSEHHLLLDIINNEQLEKIEDMEKARLLVIEDNPDTLHLVTRILANRFVIDTANNGEQGLKLFQDNDYALVLLDVMLPGMSGNQVLDAIRSNKSNQSVVIMTANHTMALAEELMLNGAADFITKPFRSEQLRRVCETATRREDFMISNRQFADKVKSLNASRIEYRKISEQHQQLLDQLGSIIIELDEQGRIVFINKAWHTYTGFSIAETQHKSLLAFIKTSANSECNVSQKFSGLLSGKANTLSVEFQLKNKFHEEIWVEARFVLASDDENKSKRISGTIDNITSRKKAQQDLEYLAMHDGLTGLYNRHFFENKLDEFSDSALAGHGSHALLYLDLDHFKIINDTVGHHQGDIVLRNLASLINAQSRQADFLARIGGDEFAILMPSTPIHLALDLAQAICKLVDKTPCKIDGQLFNVSCSIGIAEISGSFTADEYMRQADIALYSAKKQGRNMANIYSGDDLQSKQLQASLRWMRTIRQTIVDDNLQLYFQPIIEIATNKIAYYEALVRLKIDDKIILPEEFIPPLEREGDMILLDRQVVTKAIGYLSEHPKLHRISINLSAQGFSDERLLPLIKSTIKQYDVDPKRIIFELTESASLHNIAITQKIVYGLADIGCAFSIDDFGTGFSTFHYLKTLPAESVKIDGSFIVDLDKNPTDYALVKAIYDVATALGKKTVAEFVENKEVLAILAELGVNYAQGYHLGKPEPIEVLIGNCEVNL